MKYQYYVYESLYIYKYNLNLNNLNKIFYNLIVVFYFIYNNL